MTNAAFLKAYRDVRLELTVLERQLALSGSTGRPSSVGAIRWDASPGTNDVVSATLQLEDGLTAQVAQKRTELDSMQPRFDALMHSIGIFRDRCILRQYYGFAQNDDQIADCLGLTPRHVRRVRHGIMERMAVAS